MIKKEIPLRRIRYFSFILFSMFFLKPSSLCAEGTLQMPSHCDNAHFLQDRALNEDNFRKFSGTRRVFQDYPEHICGTVLKVFRAKKTRSGWHGYFLLSLGEGNIKIISNLEEMAGAPSWPWVRIGDQVEVQGRYYYDSPKKQGIDWTHQGTSRKWAWAGFVMVGNKKYE